MEAVIIKKKAQEKKAMEADVTPGFKIKFPDKLSKTAIAMLKYSKAFKGEAYWYDKRAILK